MENIISIIHTKTNEIEFDVTTENLDTKGIKVYLIIKTKKMELRFNAKQKEKDTWVVKLPVMDNFIDKTTYNCHIEVISDGYYFVPMKGSINVVGTAEIYTTTPKNKTLESDVVKKEDKKENKKKVKEDYVPGKVRYNNREKSIEQIASELIEKNKTQTLTTNVKKQKSDITENINVPKHSTINVAKKLGMVNDDNADTVENEIVAESEKDIKAKSVIDDVKKSKQKITETPIQPKVKNDAQTAQQPTPTKNVDSVKEATNDDKTIAILEEIGITLKKRPKFTIKEVKTKPLNS
jgi:hypothetical protein